MSPESEPLLLRPGDFALIPHGKGHIIRGQPEAGRAERVDLVPQEYVTENYTVLRYGGDGATSTLVCGIVGFDHPAAQRLLTLLPPVIHIEAPRHLNG